MATERKHNEGGQFLLVTSFGAFPGVHRNPTREIAQALERDPPSGVQVVGRELPVTFEGAPAAVDELVAGAARRPDVLLGLGVQGRATLRLERLARGRLRGSRVDNAGRTQDDLQIDLGADRVCTLDLDEIARELRAAGVPDVEVSSDAGGYVCELTFYQLLAHGEELGVPALFLHVPPIEAMDPAEQTRHVRTLVALLARRVAAAG
jgi:pyroglutamyl-peptidase